MNQLLWFILLSALPIVELKGSIPLIINYCLNNGLNYTLYVFLAILVNTITIILVFLFLDLLHHKMMNIKSYSFLWNKYIDGRLRKNLEKMKVLSGLKKYIALFLFVFIPIPGTGIWSGVVIAWLLGFDRLKAIMAIALGGILSGLLVLGITLGVVSIF